MANTNFDVYGYFENLCNQNKLAQANGFTFCRCTGIYYLQEAIDAFKSSIAYFCIDSTTDGEIFESNGGYYRKRIFTIFLLKRYRYNDMVDREAALSICRELFAQVYARMIYETIPLQEQYIWLNTRGVKFREMAAELLDSCTGLYFVFDIDEPINLCYDGEAWE